MFEKRKAIVLAVYKQDIAERQRHIVAMRLQTDNLGDVHALVEQVACSRSAKAASDAVARGCACESGALARLLPLAAWTDGALGAGSPAAVVVRVMCAARWPLALYLLACSVRRSEN